MLETLLRLARAPAVDRRLLDPSESMHAPHLIDLEVAQVIRRYVASGNIDSDRGRSALADLADFPLQRYRHDVLLPRIWELRDNLTAYDAAYVALAEALDAVLVTCDRRIAPAIGDWARVEVI